MLDDNNVLKQRDPHDLLGLAATQFEQARFAVEVLQPENDGRELKHIVVVGAGSSALAALLAKTWLKSDLTLPFEVVRTYGLPGYVDYNTLVIVCSYSGNTEETLAGLEDARRRSAQIAIITSGGRLKEIANDTSAAHIQLPDGLPSRMAMISSLRGFAALLAHFKCISFDRFAELADCADWLGEETLRWVSGVTTDKNYAKQLALLSVGKTPVIYAGGLMAPVAYKWKVSWNENAKNLAFCNEYPEFNHNEFIGWTSHPIEKPFTVFDLKSDLDDERIARRMEISDRLLSGKRPKAIDVPLSGESVIAQALRGCILADFVSIYVAILNGVDPMPMAVVEKLKKELSNETAPTGNDAVTR